MQAACNLQLLFFLVFNMQSTYWMPKWRPSEKVSSAAALISEDLPLSSLWHPFTFRMLVNGMSIHYLWNCFKDLLKLLECFEVIRACNIWFCPFGQSIKEYIAYNSFFSWACCICLLFFSPPSKYLGMGKSGHETLKARAAQKTMLFMSSRVMPSILLWSFIWKGQADSSDSQKYLWYCVLACIFH